MLYVYYSLTGLSIVLMLYGLVCALRLRSLTQFDKIKQSLGLVAVLICFFLVGYCVAPLVPSLPPRVGLTTK